MSDEILFEVEDHLARVTINRPEVLNAISHDMDVQLGNAWQVINSEPDIWVAILAARGDRAFCAGADVSGETGPNDSRLALGGGLTGIGGPLLTLQKPLVAAVHGY